MENNTNTICAIATALSPASIGVIRISGENAINAVENIFTDDKKNFKKLKDRYISFGYIYDKENDKILDEVIVLTMKAPHSYTKEDIVEIQSHGNNIVLSSIIRLLTKNNVRIALPGEFTKRAFLNGRIDLSKAESIIDLINSQNEFAKDSALKGLSGKIEKKINELRQEILDIVSFIEAGLDDPEHIPLDGFKIKVKEKCESSIKELEKLIDISKNGKLLKEGINTCIFGDPNVGKSSLLNLFLGEERAIVTDIAGTTRDTIKESINFNKITLNIIDTAGIRNENDIDLVEKIGIDKAKNEALQSDLVLYMKNILDCNFNYDNLKEDDILQKEDYNKINNFKKVIVIFNKIDMLEKNKKEKLNSFLNDLNKKNDNTKNIKYFLTMSTITEENFEKLKDVISNLFISQDINYNNEVIITNEREIESLNLATESLRNVLVAINDDLSEDFLTIDLNDCYLHLSHIIGEDVSEDLINNIFNKFCMGK